MKYYMVDTFTDEVFGGNPAGVCILDKEISSEVMQLIAKQHNLPETAFVLKEKDKYFLRWFTPKFEIDLCGHATLASAFVMMNYIEKENSSIIFSTQSGLIEVIRNDNKYEMSLPIRKPTKIEITEEIKELLGVTPYEVYSSRDLIVVLSSEEEVINYEPKYDNLMKLSNWLGIVEMCIRDRFSSMELIARVKAQLRRYTVFNNSNKGIIKIGDLEINTEMHRVTVAGEEKNLTPTEYKILELLGRNRNVVFSVDKIYESIWRDKYSISDTSIMVHITKLRQKIEKDSKNPEYIKTVWGVGYKI